MSSFSRPSVSDDNPYSESLFKTLKYHPGYPDKPFGSLEEARIWASGLKFVTPGQCRRGEDIAILKKRRQLYEVAKNNYPGRWSGKTRNWEPVKMVFLNPGKPVRKEAELKQANG